MLPYKIVQDLNPASVPENSSTLNVNINFDILKNTLINEQGFDKLSTTGKEIIGSCILPDNSVCIFSVLNISNILYSEIGVITDTTYKVVLRDKAANVSLGFTTEHQIKAESKVNFNGDYIVYWVDGFNPDRWLNITNPQVDIEFVAFSGEFIPSISNAAQLSLMFGFTPVKGEYIDSTATTITGGSLTAAVYYIVCTYGDKYKNFTQTLYVSSPIPVTDSQLPFNNEYIGSVAGTITDKAITISIAASRLNPEYDYIRVQVIRKQNQVVTAWLFGEFLFGSSDFKCTIDNLTNEIAVDSILINLANYKSSLAITQLDDVLYKANLKSKSEFDFQPYVNNIKVNYIQKPVDLSSTDAGENYRDPNLCFYSKGFMYDEVYALYASFIIDENGFEYETNAYHIAGRKAAAINLGGTFLCSENLDLSTVVSDPVNTWVSDDYYKLGADNNPINQIIGINGQAKIFHVINTADKNSGVTNAPVTNMGYWENKDESYSTEDKWLVYDAAGNQTGTFKNQKVRHHKFPEPTTMPYNNPPVSTIANYIHPSDTNYNEVNILGIELSNIVIPTQYIGKIRKIKMYYAKRDYNNRTILGQSLVETLNGLHFPGTNTETRNKIFNSVGNILFAAMPSAGGGNPHLTGVYPLTYELNGTNGTAETPTFKWYNYDETNSGGPANPFRGFLKMKPFDMMQQSLTPSTGSYIKNLYRIQSGYDATLFGNTNLSTSANSISAGFIFDPTGKHTLINFPGPIFSGINKNIVTGVSPYANMYRKIENAEYVDMNTPNQSVASQTSSPYNFSMLPFNYNGEKAIWVETNTRLYPAYITTTSISSQIDGDIAYVPFGSNIGFYSYISGTLLTETPSFCSPYISNICAFKLNIFESFDNQVLCEMGVTDIDSADFKFYGGDTFINVYGERETLDLSAYTPGGSNTNALITGIHNYICQTTSNVNYRYKGNNNWETFYPTVGFTEMSSLPFTNPEWYGYNPDYSSSNDLLQPVIASNQESQFQDVFPNRVIRSATDNPEIMNDNYLIYEAGNYRDVGKAKGPIENIINQSNKLLIKTRNALFYTLGREVINTQNAESYVGAGDIFAVKPKESVSSDSYGGGIGRFSDVVTQYGYMYADATNGIVYVAAPSQGDSINEISNEGLQIFFRTELKFKLPSQLYNKYFSLLPAYVSTTYLANWYVKYNNEIWKSNSPIIAGEYPGISNKWDKVDFYTLIDNTSDIQGIGIHATFDYKYRRYILAKKDYNFVEFPSINEFLGNIPETFSTSNYNKTVYYNGILYKLVPSGVALSVALPRGYTGLKINFADYFEDKSFTIAYYPEAKAWVSMYDYYPNFLAHTVDKVYSTKNTGIFKHNSDTQNNFYYTDNVIESFIEPVLNSPAGVKKFSSISFFTDVFVKTITTKALQYLDTFTSYFVRNTWQMSKETIINNTTTSRNAERIFNTNDFRDFTRNNNDPLMDTKYIPQQNASNLNATKHWSLQKKFVDYFLIPRFKFKQAWESINLNSNTIIFSSTTVLSSPNFTFNVGDTINFVYPNTLTYTFTVTKILSGNLYEFETRGTNAAFTNMTISTFNYLPNKEIHIYDINSQSTKNIR